MEFSYRAIGVIRSPYRQKFATPRQPNLVSEAEAEILFEDGFEHRDCMRGLEQFSHLWLLWHFHQTSELGWSPLVQPPRLGGKQKLGVFASRSPFRPNPIGLSVVRNLGTQTIKSQLTLRVGGIDLVDATPILDIKPYIAYADAIPQARSGFASDKPGACWDVNFTDSALDALSRYQSTYPNLKAFIISVLQQDPRPAWRARSEDDKQYGMALYDLNVKWVVTDGHVEVREICPSDRTY